MDELEVLVSLSPSTVLFQSQQMQALPIVRADYLDQTRFDGRLAMAQKMNTSFLGTYDQNRFVHTPIFIMMRSN